MLSAETIISDRPVPKVRPRVVNGRAHTPTATREAETAIGWEFRRQHPDWEMTEEDLYVEMYFALARGQRANIDNLVNTVLDGLRGVAWRDDRRIVELLARIECDAAVPRTIIIVSPASGV